MSENYLIDTHVMLSITPKWLDLIAKGVKTIEVRKSAPKAILSPEKPFKVYLYCTKHSDVITSDAKLVINNNVCNGKVVGEFICEKVDKYSCSNETFEKLSSSGSCVSMDELVEYVMEKIYMDGIFLMY